MFNYNEVGERIPPWKDQPMTTNKLSKLETLASYEGFKDSHDMLEEFIIESVVPGICSTIDCDYTTNVEPDCREGWCEECDAGTVKSCMILGGII